MFPCYLSLCSITLYTAPHHLQYFHLLIFDIPGDMKHYGTDSGYSVDDFVINISVYRRYPLFITRFFYVLFLLRSTFDVSVSVLYGPKEGKFT